MQSPRPHRPHWRSADLEAAFAWAALLGVCWAAALARILGIIA